MNTRHVPDRPPKVAPVLMAPGPVRQAIGAAAVVVFPERNPHGRGNPQGVVDAEVDLAHPKPCTTTPTRWRPGVAVPGAGPDCGGGL